MRADEAEQIIEDIVIAPSIYDEERLNEALQAIAMVLKDHQAQIDFLRSSQIRD